MLDEKDPLMETIVEGRVIVVNEGQEIKAPLPIVVTPSGMLIDVNEEQFTNA